MNSEFMLVWPAMVLLRRLRFALQEDEATATKVVNKRI
jgi:hypothetical protein